MACHYAHELSEIIKPGSLLPIDDTATPGGVAASASAMASGVATNGASTTASSSPFAPPPPASAGLDLT